MQAQPEAADSRLHTDVGLIEEAAAWMARLLADDTSDEDRLNCRRWREQNPRHEQAWQHISRISGKFAQVPKDTDGARVLEYGRRAALSRRRFLQWVGVTGLGASSAWFGLNHTRTGRGTLAEYRTVMGETRQIILNDGTRLTLNTDTAVDVKFTEDQRQIVFYHGELLIETGKESPRRDFVVDTAFGRLTALGTAFNVRQFPDHASVAVLEGAVSIKAAKNEQPLRLDVGQQTIFNAKRVTPPSPLKRNTTSWRQGVMVAERMRLADFVAEIGRYRPGFVFYDDAVADLEISGVFSIRDTDRALQSLADGLSVALVYRTRYWVKVVPQESG